MTWGGCSVVEQSPPIPGFEGSSPTGSILYRDGCNFFTETVQLTDGQQIERWQQKLFFLKYIFLCLLHSSKSFCTKVFVIVGVPIS